MVSAKLQVTTHSVRVAVRQRIAKMLALSGIFLFVVSVSALSGAFLYMRGGAHATASSTLNFQARLLSNTGSLVADGSYNIEFNLYTVDTAGTTQWTETHTVLGGNAVTVKNGYLSVSLGDSTTGTPFSGGINWDQEQWLGMTVRGTGSCAFGACTPTDSEMSPRFKLTAVPYAFRAAKLMDSTNTNAFTADDLIQKAPATPQVISAAIAAIRLNQTSSGGLLQLQNTGVDKFTVDNAGATTISGGATILGAATNINDSSNFATNINTGTSTGAVTIGSTNAGALTLQSSTSIDIGSNATAQTLTIGNQTGATAVTVQGGTGGVSIKSTGNVTIGTVDTTGTLLVLDTKNTAGDPAGTDGAMYYNSSMTRFRCYQNSSWTDCIGGASNTSATYVSGLANVGANVTGAPVETLVFTSATGVSNTAGVTGFTAPANGSFRSCLIKNNAAITAGTLDLRWRVNGASVGAAACAMDATTNRQKAEVLETGVVNFNAGDTIGIAVDTVGLGPTTNDFTVYWAVEYSSGNATGASTSLQAAYNNSLAPATILTADNKSVVFSLADTTTDSNFLVDIQTGSTGKFAVQNNGIDVLAVTSAGLTVVGTTAINTTGAATTSIGNGTGALTLTGSSGSTFVINGITIDATELSRLDTKDAALVDVNDAVTTAITGTGALASGSLGAGFGTINISSDITTSTTVTTPVLTSTAGLTLSSGGAGDLTLDSASNTIIIAANDTTLQRTAAGSYTVDLVDTLATTLVLNNSAAGAASLNLSDGDLQTAGTSRLTNGGILQNITGLTVASGGANITGNSTFVNDVDIGGNTIIGDASTDRLTLTAQILGTNAFVFQGATDDGFTTTFAITDPTANNTITIPNASGTVTLIGTAAAQIDTSTNSSLFINKTGASGNILTLQDNGAGVFTIGNDGSTTIATTSATAFVVDNAGGTDQFSVDSSGSLVRVGSATPDGTATVLIADTKNTTGDSTGGAAVNGAQYFNSFWEQYRCYRDGAWETCGINPIDRAFAMDDEFMSGYTAGACTTTTAIVGDSNWACYASGAATTAYNVGAILPTTDHPGIMRMTTAAANGNGFTVALTGNNSGSVVLAPQNRVKATVGQGATITNNRLRVGLHAQTTTNIRPTTGVWWEADATTNANWQYCFGTGGAATCAASGVPVVASTLFSLDILVTATGAGTSAATFTINGTAYNVSAVTISTAARVNPAIACFNSTAAARECFVDYYQFSGVANARR